MNAETRETPETTRTAATDKRDIAPATPGPWRFDVAYFNNESPRAMIFRAKNKPGKPMVRGAAAIGDCGEATEEAMATARLMSAAPELLCALRAMVERAEMRHPHFEKGEGETILAFARHTIKAATE